MNLCHLSPLPHHARRLAVTLVAMSVLAWPISSASAGLEADIEQLLTGASIGDTQTAVLLVDLHTGRTLVDINPDQPMVPASNMKLITTAAALTRLGPDFKFTTRLILLPPPQTAQAQEPNATPQQGSDAASATASTAPAAALPTLLVRGDGDPAFGDPALLEQAGLEIDTLIDRWVNAAKDTGHTHFEKLLIDDRIFDQHFTHRDWPAAQHHRYSYAQIAGLNFHENLLAVLPVPAINDGQTPQIQAEPFFKTLRTTNRATTGRVDDFDIQRTAGSNHFVFIGSVRNRRTHPFRVTVHDPPMFFAEYFRYRLQKGGVTVDHIARFNPQDRFDETDAVVLHEINTTLAGIVDRTNQDSQNLFAEALLKRMGYELTGIPGSFESGASAIRQFLRDRLARHVGLAAVRVADGSGLSPKNRVTARVLVTLLQQMHRDKTIGPIFAASLSHAGHTGTLRQRLRKLNSAVYGKSGYLGASANYASALSGYLVRPDGRTYAFSLLFNGFDSSISHDHIKRVQDQIMEKIDERIAASAEQ